MIKIHGVHGSPFVRKAFIMLRMKGIKYETVPQMPFSATEEYLKLNPVGKVPSLQDGDLVIGDSKVVCRYIESAYPEPPLYPTTVKDRALADWYEELAGGALSEQAARIFFERFMKPFAFQQEPDEELLAKIIEKKLPPLLDYIERQIPQDTYIFEDRFTMADLAIASPLINASYAGHKIDKATWPGIAALIDRVRAIEEVAHILEKEAALIPGADTSD